MNATSMSRLLTSAITVLGLLIGTTFAGGNAGGTRSPSTPSRSSYMPPRSHTHHAPTRTPSFRSIPRIPSIPYTPSPIRYVGARPTTAPQRTYAPQLGYSAAAPTYSVAAPTYSAAPPAVQVQPNTLPGGWSTSPMQPPMTQTQVTSNGPAIGYETVHPERFATQVQRNVASGPMAGPTNFSPMPTAFGAPPVEPTDSGTQMAQAPAPSPSPAPSPAANPAPKSDAKPDNTPPRGLTLDELSILLSDREFEAIRKTLLRAQQIKARRDAQTISSPAQTISTPASVPTTPALPTGRLATYDTRAEADEAAARFGYGATVVEYDTGLTKNGLPIKRYDVVR